MALKLSLIGAVHQPAELMHFEDRWVDVSVLHPLISIDVPMG
jgi:hypothetical protein